MTNAFTQAQVRALALEAGFTTPDARIIAAIAMVESAYSANGRSYADADKEGDQHLVTSIYGFSYGLTQIRSMYSQRGTGEPRDADRLRDPLFNLKSAHILWQKYRFQPWTTYNSGQYKAYLQDEYPPPAGVHIVTYGDTLIKITAKYAGFTWQKLAQVNGLVTPYTIYIAQPLQLPIWNYTVRSGDTLTGIAQAYAHVTVSELATFNSITNPNLIQVNQVIKIPHPEMIA